MGQCLVRHYLGHDLDSALRIILHPQFGDESRAAETLTVLRSYAEGSYDTATVKRFVEELQSKFPLLVNQSKTELTQLAKDAVIRKDKLAFARITALRLIDITK